MTTVVSTQASSQLIDLPGGRFHYLSWGVEEVQKPSVLLLHGITSSAKSWVRVGRDLADDYQVYALDMRGHGKSIKSLPGKYGLRQTADDAQDFIEALGLKSPVLIGHSWGGATAIVLASGAGTARKVPAFKCVILEDPAHNFAEGDLQARISRYTRDIGRDPAELRPEITDSNPGWTEEDIEGKIEALQQVSHMAVCSIAKEAAVFGDLLPYLAKITVPVLLLRADPLQGSALSDMAWSRAKTYLPCGSQASEVAGATHNIHRGSFSQFMQGVREFFVPI